jgi:hypothetical protein
MSEIKRADVCGGKCEDLGCAYNKNSICTDNASDPHSWCHGIQDQWQEKYQYAKNSAEFVEWLNGLLKEEFRNERFYKAAWNEAVEKDVNGMSFELEARYTLLGRPYLYRLS